MKHLLLPGAVTRLCEGDHALLQSSPVYLAVTYFKLKSIHAWLCLPNYSSSLRPERHKTRRIHAQGLLVKIRLLSVLSQVKSLSPGRAATVHSFCRKPGQVTLYASPPTAKQLYFKPEDFYVYFINTEGFY